VWTQVPIAPKIRTEKFAGHQASSTSRVLRIGAYVAGSLNRRLVPGKAVIGGRLKVGVFFVIPVLATVPVNLFSLALGIVQPRDVPGYWFYFPSMAVVALALFYRHWRSFPPGRKCLIVLSALGLSTIPALG
jgi:hypothetical protein